MLFALDMEFVGQPQSGLDDAKNIARVLVTKGSFINDVTQRGEGVRHFMAKVLTV